MSSISQLFNNPQIEPALTHFASNADQLIEQTIAVQQIPAPTFDEGARASYVEAQFWQHALSDVMRDATHNVYGRLAGKNSALKPLVLSAHSDTVFPHGTDLTVTREGTRVYGPGIADNSAGVGGLLTLIGVMQQYKLQPQRDVWFVVNVCEEGLGDLRGMRTVTDRFADAHGFVVIEGGMYGYLLHEAIGVQRYRVTVTADGGHSWSDFGRTSAIHVLSQLIAQIDSIRLSKTPKTTYNVGTIEGGTTINTIAASASFLLDLRSEDPNSLNYLVTQFEAIVRKVSRKYDQATLTVEEIGNRPAGSVPRSNALVKSADSALRAVGCKKIQYLRGSTDANIPLSRNLPAVCIGLTRSANAHRLDEYLDTTDFARGMQQLLLLTLAAADY